MYGWQITHGKILEMEGRLVAKGRGVGEGCVCVCVSKKAVGGSLWSWNSFVSQLWWWIHEPAQAVTLCGAQYTYVHINELK